jgi:predicted PurR-regulated permease PerM
MINIGVGVTTGLLLALAGLPNALLFGVLAVLLNYIPYLGPLFGTMITFVVSVATFTDPVRIAIPPLLFFLVTALEGNLVTPAILGRRFVMNPIIIFLWLASWGIFWGAAGMLIAMPLLAAFAIMCREVPALKNVSRFIEGGADTSKEDDATAPLPD